MSKNNVLSLIGQYCPHVKSLTFDNYSARDVDFYRMYGHKLEELILYDSMKKSKEFLKFSPNLKSIFIVTISFLLIEDKEFLPKLEHILNNLDIRPEKVQYLKIMSDKYRCMVKHLRH